MGRSGTLGGFLFVIIPRPMRIEPGQKSLKTQLRKELRQKRAAVDERQRSDWDALINRNLETYTGKLLPRVVAAFKAFDGEPDLSPALVNLARKGVTLALPVVADAPGKAVISLREWSPDKKLQPNRYGISEPAGTAEIRVPDIDLILVPLVGWDRSGARLGMGASFYDRLFQPFVESEHPVRIGVAYALQQVESIPSEPWDVPLHAILTENGYVSCPF